jgi:hypothetical protein
MAAENRLPSEVRILARLLDHLSRMPTVAHRWSDILSGTMIQRQYYRDYRSWRWPERLAPTNITVLLD